MWICVLALQQTVNGMQAAVCSDGGGRHEPPEATVFVIWQTKIDVEHKSIKAFSKRNTILVPVLHSIYLESEKWINNELYVSVLEQAACNNTK